MSKEFKIQSMELLKSLGLIVIAVHGIKDGACTCSNRKECQSPGKHPVKKHWKDNPIQSLNEINPLMIDREYANLGVVTGNGLVVVDIDPKNGGIESFKMIEHLFNPTFTVVTGSGGYHFYYYLPSDYNKAVSNRVNVLNGIDVRGDGGFVVAPGSLHKSGNLYEIADDSLSAIQVIGTELLDLITKEKSYEHASPIQNNSELVDYFGEGERNYKMAAIAGNLFRQGLSIDGVRDSLLSINDSVCSPPLSGKEVESIVKSISKYKNNEQQDLSEDKLETPAGKVRALLHSSKLNANKKNEQISNLIIEDLCQQGKFYKALGDYFYFNCETKKLISIHVENINYKSLLAQYGINASTSFYSYISQGIAVHCEVEGEETQVFKYARYDAENNRVYLKNKEGMYKITPDAVSCCDNGTDGVLFSDLIEVDDYKFIEDLDDQDYIEQFITTLGNYDAAYMSTETQKLLVKCYFVSLFMPEFLGTKPLLVVVGTKGSAKTTLLKAFVKCLYGAKHSVTAMVNKADDLDVTVINSHFAAIDNLDTYKEWLSDKLAVYATGGYIKKRKLYTDAQMYESFIDSFIGITTRTLNLKDEDWFVFTDNYGTSEEKEFVAYFKDHVQDLKNKYDNRLEYLSSLLLAKNLLLYCNKDIA